MELVKDAAETGERIELAVDKSGRVVLPEELAAKLAPGTTLTVESRQNGKLTVRVGICSHEAVAPHLVRKGKSLVIAGTVTDDFDWDTFLQEGRERPIAGLAQYEQQVP